MNMLLEYYNGMSVCTQYIVDPVNHIIDTNTHWENLYEKWTMWLLTYNINMKMKLVPEFLKILNYYETKKKKNRIHDDDDDDDDDDLLIYR